jgi:hypothetical protein
VRPKEFHREPLTTWGQDDFMKKTMDEVGTHNFNKLDETIHLRKFHDTQRQLEMEQSGREEAEGLSKKASVRERINKQVKLARDRAEFMDQWIEEGRQSWAVNEAARQQREKTRLQFELMTLASSNAKKNNERIKHDVDQKMNIVGFERNMKRLGVGADDGMDDGEMRPTVESGLNYLSRLEDTVTEAKFGEAGNYEVMENLHRAEKVNRKARKERETRRRKMLVEQNAAKTELAKREAGREMMEGMKKEAVLRRQKAERDWQEKREKERTRRRNENELEEKRLQREAESEEKLRAFFATAHEEALGEASLENKQKRLDEIAAIKLQAQQNKRRTATACAENAVSKLLDAVEVMCCERAELNGPVPPQFWRDVKRCYVSNRPFFEEEVSEDNDEWTLREQAGGYAEGLSWISGGQKWGETFESPLQFNVVPSIPDDVRTKITTGVKSSLSSLSRDYVSVQDYVSWTLYEYASYLRRDDEKWIGVCKNHRKIVRMPTDDNTDLDAIETAIDALEEDLGDIAEERNDGNRDVCDGSSGRAREWIDGIVAARSNNMKNLCKLTVESADAELADVLLREDVAREAAAAAAEQAAIEAEVKAAEDKLKEEEAAAAAAAAEEEAANAKPVKESKADEKARLEREAEEAEAAEVAAIEAENARMAEEERVERERQAEADKRAKIQEVGKTALAEAKDRLSKALSGSEWLHSATCTEDGAIQLARSLGERVEDAAEAFLASGDSPSFYDCSVILSRLANSLGRIECRFLEFERQVRSITEYLCEQMDAMCGRRAEFENECVTNLASRLGKAAAAHWKEPFKFRVDFSGDALASNDAKYPGVVFDSRGKNFNANFLVLLAKRFKEACKSNATVSMDSFVKIVQRAVEKEQQRGGDVSNFGWTGSENLRRIAQSMGNQQTGGGRVPWKKFLHCCVCHSLPSLASLEELVKMGITARKIGVPMSKQDGNLGISKQDFMALHFWFDGPPPGAKEGDVKALDGETVNDIKEVYSIAFGDEAGEMVNISEGLLTWSCWGGEEMGKDLGFGGVDFPIGFLRACCAHGNVDPALGVVLKPGSGEIECGPTVTCKQLEDMIKMDFSLPEVGFAEGMFKKAGGGESEGDVVSFGALQKALAEVKEDGQQQGWKGFTLCELVV